MRKNFEKKLALESKSSVFQINKIPKKYKDDVFKLYTIFYLIGSYGNPSHENTENLKYIIRRWQSIKRDDLFASYKANDDSANEKVLSNLAYLVNRYEIDTKDVDDYFRSIAIKLKNKQINTSQDYARFMNYTAEAPALVVTKVLQLPNALSHHAKMFARSIQMINALLSINSSKSGYILIPKFELKKFGLPDLEPSTIANNKEAFSKLVQLQINRYKAWRDESKKGDEFLPKKLKPIIKSTRARYDLIASMIEKNPLVLIEVKIKKPSKIRVKVKALIDK